MFFRHGLVQLCCLVLTVYNIMLIKERIKLTEHPQSVAQFNITAYNQKDRPTPYHKKNSHSSSLHQQYSLVKMGASTSISETQPPPEKRSKSVQKQTTDVQTFNKSRTNYRSNNKKRRHITDCQNISYGVPLLGKYSESAISNDLNKNQRITIRKRSEISTILQNKRNTVDPISITQKVNETNKQKTAKHVFLKDSHFQMWINEVLLQSCNQKFDRTINLSAVKKYMIDNASLSAFGINELDISRIYRILYVYSVGFSNVLQEIKGISSKAYRNIWKVYSILLQHCSRDDFQTMMSEIETQNLQKLQKLQDQLQEKQEIIEQNDELNREKNSKIFKEIKNLKEENFHLTLEKDVIGNDCREFQKAFNEEVSLRMLFQQKITSIYCVYNQINNKHAALFKEYQSKSTDLELLLEENKRLAEDCQQARKQMFGIQSDNKMLTRELAQIKQQLSKTQEYYSKRSSQENQMKLQLININRELLEAHQECKKMAKKVQMIEGNNTHLRQTYHMLQLDYQNCLNQNRRLISTVQEQFAINKKYFQEKSKIDRGVVKYQNEVALYRKKIEDSQNLIDELKSKILGLQETINEMKNESVAANENINKLNKDVAVAQQNIEKFKVINQQNQSIIEEQKRKVAILSDQFDKSFQQKYKSQDAKQQHERRNENLDCKNKELTSQIQILKQKLASQLKAKQKAKTIQLAQRKKEQRQLNIFKKELIAKQIQVDKLKQLYENTMLNINNGRFEMKNLQLSYKQCLNVIDNYTKVIKDINSKHSDLEDKLQEEKRSKKINQLNYENDIKTIHSSSNILRQQIQELTEYCRRHQNCINQMIYQDLYARLQRSQQKELLRQQIITGLKQITNQAKQKYQSTLNQRDEQITQLRSKIKTKESQLDLQIQYQKKKNYELNQELQEVELQLAALKNYHRSPIQEFREKQRRYLEVIKEKNQKIQIMIQEIDVMQQQNLKLVERITNSQKQLTASNQKLQQVQEDLLALQNEKQKVESQRNEAIDKFSDIKRQLKVEIPEKNLQKGQYQNLIKISNVARPPDVYLRQMTKSIELQVVEAHRESKPVEDQNHNQSGADQKATKANNKSDKDKRQEFANIFKNASQYYIK